MSGFMEKEGMAHKTAILSRAREAACGLLPENLLKKLNNYLNI
jgi:hypothetical protein